MAQVVIMVDEETAARALLGLEDHVRRLAGDMERAEEKALGAPTTEIRQARQHDARRLVAAHQRAEGHASHFREAMETAARVETVGV